MVETLADLLIGRPALSNRTALLFGDQAYTYAELESQSNQVANALIAQNIQSGDFVCQAVASRPELIVNLFGILKSGARYAPLNPSLTERELSEQLTDCRPSVLIAEDEVAEKLRDAPASAPGLRVWRVGEWAAECRRMPDKRPSREVDPQGPALLFYTSGTSGRSKGVQLAFVGAPDAQYGEQVVAFVVLLRDRASSLKSVEAGLLAHCRVRLARFKVPARIEEINDLPKNAIGKVLKQALTEVLKRPRQ